MFHTYIYPYEIVFCFCFFSVRLLSVLCGRSFYEMILLLLVRVLRDDEFLLVRTCMHTIAYVFSKEPTLHTHTHTSHTNNTHNTTGFSLLIDTIS